MRRLLAKVFKLSAMLHLVIPLVVTAILSTGLGWFRGHRTIPDLWHYWREGPLYEVLAIYVTFVIVLAVLLKEETDPRPTRIAVLDDALADATSYFALGVISLHEWFEPAAQVYLARIFARHASDEGFEHQRVLVFTDEATLNEVNQSFAEEFYARCFSSIHKSFKTPLAYVGPEHLNEILDSMDMHVRDQLGWFAKASLLGRLKPKSSWGSRNPRRLAFAVAYRSESPISVVLFTKAKRTLALTRITDQRLMTPYVQMAQAVKARVFFPGTTTIRREHDFAQLLDI